MSSQPITQLSDHVTRFLFSAVRYTMRDPAIVIAVVNLKGGCGKSTIAVNLACELASNGDTVRLLDAEPVDSFSPETAGTRCPDDR